MIIDLIGGNQSNLLNEEIVVFELSLCPIDLVLKERMKRTVVNRRMVSDRDGLCSQSWMR